MSEMILNENNSIEIEYDMGEKKVKKWKEKKIKEPKVRAKMNQKKKKKIIKFSIFGGILLVIILFFVFQSVAAKGASIPVETVTVKKGTINSSIETSGTVKSEITRTYFSNATTKSNIQDVNVELGDVVKAGDQLLTFNIEDMEASSKQTILQGEASKYSYQGTAEENAKFQQQLAKAVTEIQNYHALMALQKEYIKQLEDSINDEIIKKRANLYNQQYSLNRSLANYQYELTKEDLSQKVIDNMQKVIAQTNAEIARVGNEISLLSDYKTKDNREDILIKAKNDYSDLEIACNEAKTYQSGAEAALKNGATMKSEELKSEASQVEAERAASLLEEAKKGITADFSGVITKVNAIAGGPAIDGAELLTLESNENVKVEISVSKYDLVNLKVNQKADITINGNSYKGTVSKINHVAIPNSAGTPMVTVEVHIDDGDENIFLGIEAKAVIHTKEAKDVLIAPIESVNADTEGDFCYIVKDGVVVRKPVKIGISSDDDTEIVEGLSEGDQIITALPNGVVEGAKVEAMPKDEAATE